MSEKDEREALCRYSVLLEGDEPSDEAEKFDLILVRYSIFLYSTNAEDSWLMLARILARLAPLGVLVRVRVRVRVTLTLTLTLTRTRTRTLTNRG